LHTQVVIQKLYAILISFPVVVGIRLFRRTVYNNVYSRLIRVSRLGVSENEMHMTLLAVKRQEKEDGKMTQLTT